MKSILDMMNSLTGVKKGTIYRYNLPHHILQEFDFNYPKHIVFEEGKTPTDSMCKCGGSISKLNSTLKITLPKPFHRKKEY